MNFYNDSGKIASLNALPFTDNGTLVNRHQFLQYAGLADGTTTTHAEFYILPNVTVYNSADEIPTDTEVYSIFTTKNYCYYPSKTITLTSGWGYVSAEGKSVEVWFPVAKYLDKVSGATVTLMKGNFRAGKTYWVVGKYTAGGHDFTNSVTSVSLIPEQKLISVILESSEATKTNLGGDSVSLNNFTIQFNGTLQIKFT